VKESPQNMFRFYLSPGVVDWGVYGEGPSSSSGL
jgi:hypothetical protein